MSVLVFGTAGLGLPYGLAREGDAASLLSDDEAAGLVEAALAAGVDVFDTAPAYGLAEERLGRALGARGQVWTKLGRHETIGPSLLPDARLSLARSLDLLRRDAVDVLQWHNWTADLGSDPTFVECWQRLREDARVRRVGATTYGPADAVAAVDSGLFDQVQVEWNILNPRVLDAIGEVARRRGVSIAVRSVFLQGALTDEPRQIPPLPALRARVDAARRVAREAGLSLRDLALRSALEHDAVSYVLMGIDRPSQIVDALRVAEAGPLAAPVRAKVRSLAADWDPALDPRTWPV